MPDTQPTDATTGAARLELLKSTQKTCHFHNLTNWVKQTDQQTDGQMLFFCGFGKVFPHYSPIIDNGDFIPVFILSTQWYSVYFGEEIEKKNCFHNF